MVRRLLTPRWLSIHLLALVLAVACVLLGRWQLDRAAAFHQSASSEPGPVPLTSLTQPQGALPGAAIGRLVTVSGTFDPAHSYLVPDREVAGRTGFWLLSVLRVPGTGTGSGSGSGSGDGVLVVRGWVAAAADAAAVAAPTSPVRVTGRLMDSEDPSGGLPAGTTLPAGQVAAASPVTLLPLVPYPLFDGYVVLRAQQPPPPAGVTLVPSPHSGNDVPGFYVQHLAYVALWWLFAAFVAFFWWRLVRDEVAGPSGRGGGAEPSAAA
jgi:cytochrome oxidase assembly protein ShyY1